MTAPRYQDIAAADIPEVVDDDGTRVRIVVGEFWGKRGPVEGVAADPRYIDVSVPPGSGTFRDASGPQGILTEQVDGATMRSLPHESENRSLILFDRGDEVVVQAGDQGIRFLLVSGKPIEEPVAWYGPIVMNTEQELRQALSELRDGTFISR
jgi:redox-sensitive bicupin YhaK (pirin superfamily)